MYTLLYLIRKCGPYLEWRIQLKIKQIICRKSVRAIERDDSIETSFVLGKIIALKRVHDLTELRQAHSSVLRLRI